MKNYKLNSILFKLGTSLKEVVSLEKTEKKDIINIFKEDDVVACFAGYPIKELCVVELTKDNPDVNNFKDYITGNSMLPLTSHLISANWFKITK